MKRIDWKELGLDILVDIAAGLLIAIGVYNFALNADFPVAGFSGIAIIMYHLLNILKIYHNYFGDHGLCGAASAGI